METKRYECASCGRELGAVDSHGWPTHAECVDEQADRWQCTRCAAIDEEELSDVEVDSL